MKIVNQLILSVLILSFSTHVSAALREPFAEPCFAKDLLDHYPLLPDSEIILFSGHTFRRKDPCVPFNVTIEWTERYYHPPYAVYDFKFKESLTGELWYKKDREEIAFSANRVRGPNRLLSFSAKGDFCDFLSEDHTRCIKMKHYGSAKPNRKEHAGSTIHYSFPAIPNVVDEILFISSIDFHFIENRGDYITWITNLKLNPFKYDEIVSAIESRKSYNATISYNNDNDVDDIPSRKKGTVRMKFDFNPKCPHKLKIVSPTKKQFAFSSTTPGSLTISASINSDFPAEHLDKVKWYVPEKYGSGLIVTPLTRSGGNIDILYSGLPFKNDDFGKTILEVSADLGGDCGELKDEKEIEIFFDRDASNNPVGNEPNWFYYWQQTSAGHGTVRNQNIIYHAREELCGTVPEWLGYVPHTMTGPDNSIREFASFFYICDFHKYDYYYQHFPSENFLTFGIVHTNKMWEGIDTFGVVVLHELTHLNNANTWWPNGWSTRGIVDRNGNGIIEPEEIIGLDVDQDFIPDKEEEWLPGNYNTNMRITHEQFTYDWMYDEHHYTYSTSEKNWQTGSADHEDWAKPGKQWLGVD